MTTRMADVGPAQPKFQPDLASDYPLTPVRPVRLYDVNDPPPDPKDYTDPIVFGLAWKMWKARNPKRAFVDALATYRRNRVLDEREAACRYRNQFDGPGEGENR